MLKIRYCYERIVAVRDAITSLLRPFRDGRALFYSDGSLADNYLHFSALSQVKEEFHLITHHRQKDLVKSFNLEGKTVFADDSISSLFSEYFSLTSEWLYSNNDIKPLLAVYYPIVPDLINHSRVLDHWHFITTLCGLHFTTSIVSPLAALQDQENISSLSGRFRKIAILPETNTLETLSDQAWLILSKQVQKFCELHGYEFVIVLGPRSNLRDAFNPECIFFPKPHQVIPFVSSCEFVISAMSGAYHLSRILTNTRIIGIANYCEGDIVYAKGRTFSVGVQAQHSMYSAHYKSPHEIINYKKVEDLIKVLEILNNPTKFFK